MTRKRRRTRTSSTALTRASRRCRVPGPRGVAAVRRAAYRSLALFFLCSAWAPARSHAQVCF